MFFNGYLHLKLTFSSELGLIYAMVVGSSHNCYNGMGFLPDTSTERYRGTDAE